MYEPLTQRRPDESFDDFYKRDGAAKKAKEQWHLAQGIREMIGQAHEPEPIWNDWEPTPMLQAPSPSLPITDPPPWMRDLLPPRAVWEPVVPATPLPAGQGPEFDFGAQPASIFDDEAPAQPVVVYPDRRVESLALRPKDVWTAVGKGAEFALENGRWIVRVGSKVLGPIGAVGAAKDLYDFDQWLAAKLATEPNPPRTRYEPSTNTILWEHPGGSWSVTPPAV